MVDIHIITAYIFSTSIMVETQARFAGTKETSWSESRPASLALADTALAAHSLRRVGEWDLGPNGSIKAPVKIIDNVFNGTRAARLDQAVGTTHEEFKPLPVKEAREGDLISDLDLSAYYVVAGCRRERSLYPGAEGGIMKIHMVGEGQDWEERYTTDFAAHQVVQIAHRKPASHKATGREG